MTRPSPAPALRGVLALAGLALALLLAAPANAETQACADCHGELAGKFAGSAHGKSFAHDPALSGANCQSCHVAAAKHAESGDPADVRNPRLDKAAAAAACLACHANQAPSTHWQGSAHEVAGVSCLDCHAVHAGQVERHGVKIAGVNDLCLSCHTTVRVAMTQRSRHPLREDKMDCADCHNPHGTINEKLVKRDSVNDLCFTCHQEMRGPFLWEHSPVREDCMTCHKPHGSNNDKLLVARASQLCESCHLQGRHQTVAGSDSAIWNSNRACLNCHSQIHGSNHPSGPLFQR